MTHRSTLTLALALGAATTLVTPPGLAQSASDKALAEAMFREGRKLLTSGDVDAACAKLSESQRLDPSLGALLNLALCHEKQGRSASAWAEFTEASSLARRTGDQGRSRFAEQHAKALQAQLSTLVLESEQGAKLRIRIGERAIAASAIGTPLPLDPGEHEVVVEADGFEPWQQKVTIAPGPGSQTLSIPTLTPRREANETPRPATSGLPRTAPVAQPTPIAPDESEEPSSESSIDGMLIGGAVVGTVGLAGVVVGAVFGARTLSKEKDADTICPAQSCPTQQGVDMHQDAKTFATVSTVGFVVGGVALATGVALVALSLSKGPTPGEGNARLELTTTGARVRASW